jgi:hypothetical protein
MADLESLRMLCLDESGNAKDKDDCRAALINHLILDEMLDIDEAEDKTDGVLNELGLWKEQEMKDETRDSGNGLE